MNKTFGSVCSGIEAASAAWHPLGWEAAFLSEIEPFPSAVLAHHYPDTPNLGDMTKFKEWPDANIDVLVGGTPCQSFSVAGLRKGLDDPRGNLMLTFGAIAAKYRPQWLVWENVPGVLSSNGGRDFGTFLGMLGELGYGFAYRVLDAQYFGVAQRRRRVFVVGHLGDWRRAAAVLFERHSLSGHPAPSRKAGQVAPTIPSRSLGGGGLGTDFDCDGGLIHSVAGTISRCSFSGGAGGRPEGASAGHFIPVPHAAISPALKARDCKGVSSDGDGDGAILVPMVSHSLRGEGFDASEDGTGRGTPLVAVHGTQDPCTDGHVAFALGRNNGQENAIAFAIQAGALRTNPASGPDGVGVQAGISYTLEARSEVQAVAVGAFKGGQGASAGGIGYDEHVAPTLSSADSGSNRTPALLHGMAVRRLTPKECERLQGFPDDYTLIPYRNKPAADGPRYKALGNSMAVPVMAWIGKRIQMVDAIPDLAAEQKQKEAAA